MAKDERNLPCVLWPHARHGKAVERKTVAKLYRKIVRRMRLLQAHPQGERLVLVLVEKRRGLARPKGAPHIRQQAGVGKPSGVKPDLGGVFERSPGQLLRRDTARQRLWPCLFAP